MSTPKSITLNGAPHRSSAATIADLVRELELAPTKVAVERNGAIVPRSTLEDAPLAEGDKLEIVHFVGGGDHAADTWTVAGRTFTSRLIVGTGKYKSFEQNAAAVAASGAEIVTVAVRRVNVSDPKAQMLTDFIDPKKITYLPNTAGCGGMGSGQARGVGRGAHALSRYARDAEGDRGAGQGRLSPHGLLRR
jgi:thiazole synthase